MHEPDDDDDDTALEPVAAGIATATAVLSLSAAGFVELVLAKPLPGTFYAASIAMLALATARALLAAPRPLGLSAIVNGSWWLGAALALLALFVTPWTSRKPFLHQLEAIEPGMSRGEVLQIMDGYARGEGAERDDALVFRHSDDARFYSDSAIVTFAGEKVASVEFRSD